MRDKVTYWRTTVDELITFLRARLDEDERTARSTMWDGSENVPDWHLSASATVETGGDTLYVGDRTVANHIERHDPARVLRDIEAGRRILSLYVASRERDEWMRQATGEAPTALATAAYGEALKALALSHADHEDYQEAWRP